MADPRTPILTIRAYDAARRVVKEWVEKGEWDCSRYPGHLNTDQAIHELSEALNEIDEWFRAGSERIAKTR